MKGAVMAYWLFKSEPNTWSFEDQLAKGDEGEGWDGVRNHQAGNNMKAMEIDELGFFERLFEIIWNWILSLFS